MFTPENIIDTIQGTKRTFTNMVIKDEVLNKVANNFIDSQTHFAKMLVTNFTTVTKYGMDQLTTKLFFKN